MIILVQIFRGEAVELMRKNQCSFAHRQIWMKFVGFNLLECRQTIAIKTSKMNSFSIETDSLVATAQTQFEVLVVTLSDQTPWYNGIP